MHKQPDNFTLHGCFLTASSLDCPECNKMLKVQDVQRNSHYLALVNYEINKKNSKKLILEYG